MDDDELRRQSEWSMVVEHRVVAASCPNRNGKCQAAAYCYPEICIHRNRKEDHAEV